MSAGSRQLRAKANERGQGAGGSPGTAGDFGPDGQPLRFRQGFHDRPHEVAGAYVVGGVEIRVVDLPRREPHRRVRGQPGLAPAYPYRIAYVAYLG